MATVLIGNDGSATYATVAIPNLRNIRTSTKRGTINTSVKGDKHTQVKPGIVTSTVTMEALLDYETGQQDLIDFLETATPDTSVGTLVITLASGKTLTYTSGALYLGHEITSPDGDNPVTVTFEFAVTVPATVAWA
jgi:hypothetical protein